MTTAPHGHPPADSATAPLCLGPLDSVEPPAFALPALACDTHAHVIAAGTAFPLVDNRSYTPPPAPEDLYLKHLDALGLARGVLVQPSIYGTDNRYLLQVLARHPQRLRGVAVVDGQISDRELARMHACGVRGIRFNLLFKGGVGLDALESLAARVDELGWHIQLLIDIRELPDLLPRLQKLPCPVVIDHMGHMPVATGMQHPGFTSLLRMVSEQGWWVKLSGAYRISDQFDDFADVTPWARRLIEASPQSMLWGSDWPHVALQRMPDTGRLLNQLLDWASDAQPRELILADNPARLYDFA